MAKIFIDTRKYRDYNKVFKLTIPYYHNGYLETIRHFFDRNVDMLNMDYDRQMDFIYYKFKNEEFEEYTVTETFKVLDKEEIDLSREARRRRAIESTKKYREQAFKEVRDNMKKLIDSINHYYDV